MVTLDLVENVEDPHRLQLDIQWGRMQEDEQGPRDLANKMGSTWSGEDGVDGSDDHPTGGLVESSSDSEEEVPRDSTRRPTILTRNQRTRRRVRRERAMRAKDYANIECEVRDYVDSEDESSEDDNYFHFDRLERMGEDDMADDESFPTRSVPDSPLDADEGRCRSGRKDEDAEGHGLEPKPISASGGLFDFEKYEEELNSQAKDLEARFRAGQQKIIDSQRELEARKKIIEEQRKKEKEGRKVPGVTSLRDIGPELSRITAEDRAEKRQEDETRRAINILTKEQQVTEGRPLCGAWRSEDAGWTKVQVVMDSGAAESVCPKSMAPHIPIRDSAAMLAGVFYTAANGGKIFNLGEQQVPVAFGGVRTMALFQVADVSRPLMSVARICEMGNRVIFGAAGGVILNLKTGQSTSFHKVDGVYVFDLWVPSVSEAPFLGRP